MTVSASLNVATTDLADRLRRVEAELLVLQRPDLAREIADVIRVLDPPVDGRSGPAACG